MFRKALLATAMTLALATPAYAGHCPADAAAIDAALANMSLSDETKAKVEELRNSGMSMHDAGDHRGAEGTLAEAMRTLLTSDN